MLQIGHVHVIGLKACFGEGIGHFHMGIDALLAQYGNARTALTHIRRSHIVQSTCGQMQMQTRVLGVTGCSMFGIGRGGGVALGAWAACGGAR